VKIIDGKALSEIIQAEIKAEVDARIKAGLNPPHLSAVLVGNDGASETYVANKIRMCENVGFKSSLFRYDASITESELMSEIHKLNLDDDIDGYIVQLPIPKHISVHKVIEAILPQKDVDGFHPINFGKMTQQLPCFIPATPKGIMQLLERYNIPTKGKHCVVIGRSNIVGTPMSILLSRNSNPGNCTVTLCHSHTENLKSFTLQADIIVAAIGIPNFVKGDMIKEGAVVIDVGMTRAEDKSKKSGFRLFGDVDFESASKVASYITPVPGGVGPMTIIGLLQNTLLASKKIVQS
jgi:methylenetetrahydrofolate dehydrogenase (NADP+) / methenyltetrahydrofolate cyclohydrolase